MKSPVCLLLCAVFFVTGCRTGRSTNIIVVEDNTPTANALAIIDAAEDRRTLVPALNNLIDQADPGMRRQLAVALGRIGDPKGSRLLVSLISDPDAEVRQAAYFASGLLGTIPGTLRTALALQLKKENASEGVAAIADALGRAGSTKDVARLSNLLDDSRDAVRASAMQALGRSALRNLPIAEPIAIHIAGYLKDPAEAVRVMSAFALRRIPPISGKDAVVKKLADAAVADSSAEVRILALSALGKWDAMTAATLAHALRDPDFRIGTAALRALRAVPPDARRPLVLRGLETVAQRVAEDSGLVEGSYASLVLASLEAAIPFRGSKAIVEQADLIIRASEGLGNTRTAGATRILCLARLVAGRNELALLSCDPERPETGKQVAMLNLYLGKGTPPENIDILKQWLADTSLEVAVAAVTLLGRIDDPGAKRAVLDALKDERAVVVTAALLAIGERPALFHLPSDEIELETTINEIGGVVSRFQPFEHAHAPLIAAAKALQALGDPGARPTLLRLGSDTRPAVRHAVRDAFDTIHSLTPPAGFAPLNPVRPFSHEKKTATQLRQARMVVMTSRGGFSISLNNATAPAAVESFVELARSGFYNGTTFHRVLPGQLVQAGDPTGTGMGDAGYCLRGEPTREPFQRGTLGMTQSVKDSASSQFFITLSRQPALDGNYTVLGQVESGIETVELLAEGDVIEEVIVKVE